MSSPGETHTPSEASRRHARRKWQARLQLTGILLLLVLALGVFFDFAFEAGTRTRWPEMVGILFGGSAAMTLLFGAVWGRQGWARHVLVAAILCMLVVFSLYLLSLMTNPDDANSPGVRKLSIGLGCMLGAMVWLIFSRRISYLTTASGSGGRA